MHIVYTRYTHIVCPDPSPDLPPPDPDAPHPSPHTDTNTSQRVTRLGVTCHRTPLVTAGPTRTRCPNAHRCTHAVRSTLQQPPLRVCIGCTLCLTEWLYVAGGWGRCVFRPLTPPSARNSLRICMTGTSSHFKSFPEVCHFIKLRRFSWPRELRSAILRSFISERRCARTPRCQPG